MRTKSFFLAFLFILSASVAFSQREETLLGQRSWGFSGIWGGYNHQITNFGSTEAYNQGGFFEFEFGKSLLIGWGHYSLDNSILWKGSDQQRFNFRTNVFKLGYQFFPYKAVHPMINLDLGRGWMDYGTQPRDRVLVVQPAVGVEVNIFRWFRVGLEGGYRFIRNTDIVGLSDKDFSGLYGQGTLKFGFSWGRYHKRQEERDKKYQE
jgi:hypothetical protein